MDNYGDEEIELCGTWYLELLFEEISNKLEYKEKEEE